MEKKLVIPKKGVKVRDPQTGQHIPEEGVFRSIDSYFNRRIKDGDLEVRDIPHSITKAAQPSKKAVQKDGDK